LHKDSQSILWWFSKLPSLSASQSLFARERAWVREMILLSVRLIELDDPRQLMVRIQLHESILVTRAGRPASGWSGQNLWLNILSPYCVSLRQYFSDVLLKLYSAPSLNNLHATAILEKCPSTENKKVGLLQPLWVVPVMILLFVSSYGGKKWMLRMLRELPMRFSPLATASNRI
jgi:hypothetical protein